MIPLAEAQRTIAALVSVAPRPATVPRADALGLVLAADVVAAEPVPPFANTAMDGYAVRAADTAGATAEQPVRLHVVDEIPAGRASAVVLGPGEAARIMTGAPVPAGADAIVMVEATERAGADGVDIHTPAGLGDHVRPAGGDVAAGAVVFARGTVLGAAHLGVLASLDVAEVPVYARVRVGVLSTGDEVVESGPLVPGRIRDANRPMLLALVAEAGAHAVDLGIAPDDDARIEAVLRAALDHCDAIVTSGAVSVGDYDFVKLVIDRLARERGGESRWMQIAIRPAKPLAVAVVGRGDDAVPIFGLPGNPVSSHVSFELFARPALRARMGHGAEAARPVVTAFAEEAMARRSDGKVHLDRVLVWADADGTLRCRRSGFQASNVLSGMAAANGLAVLADGPGPRAGEPVPVMLLGLPHHDARTGELRL